MRLIDADNLYKILENKATMDDVCLLSTQFTLKQLAEIIYTLPTVERPKGKWIRETSYFFVDVSPKKWETFKCNICRGVTDSQTDFCPHCGAEMEGVAKNATTTEEAKEK